MYISYQQLTATATVQNANVLAIPAGATHAEVQADTQHVRYTMDNSTSPTQAIGMLLLTTAEPKLFSIDDIRRIHWVRGAGTNGVINFHYIGRRE